MKHVFSYWIEVLGVLCYTTFANSSIYFLIERRSSGLEQYVHLDRFLRGASTKIFEAISYSYRKDPYANYDYFHDKAISDYGSVDEFGIVEYGFSDCDQCTSIATLSQRLLVDYKPLSKWFPKLKMYDIKTSEENQGNGKQIVESHFSYSKPCSNKEGLLDALGKCSKVLTWRRQDRVRIVIYLADDFVLHDDTEKNEKSNNTTAEIDPKEKKAQRIINEMNRAFVNDSINLIIVLPQKVQSTISLHTINANNGLRNKLIFWDLNFVDPEQQMDLLEKLFLPLNEVLHKQEIPSRHPFIDFERGVESENIKSPVCSDGKTPDFKQYVIEFAWIYRNAFNSIGTTAYQSQTHERFGKFVLPSIISAMKEIYNSLSRFGSGSMGRLVCQNAYRRYQIVDNPLDHEYEIGLPLRFPSNFIESFSDIIELLKSKDWNWFDTDRSSCELGSNYKNMKDQKFKIVRIVSFITNKDDILSNNDLHTLLNYLRSNQIYLLLLSNEPYELQNEFVYTRAWPRIGELFDSGVLKPILLSNEILHGIAGVVCEASKSNQLKPFQPCNLDNVLPSTSEDGKKQLSGAISSTSPTVQNQDGGHEAAGTTGFCRGIALKLGLIFIRNGKEDSIITNLYFNSKFRSVLYQRLKEMFRDVQLAVASYGFVDSCTTYTLNQSFSRKIHENIASLINTCPNRNSGCSSTIVNEAVFNFLNDINVAWYNKNIPSENTLANVNNGQHSGDTSETALIAMLTNAFGTTQMKGNENSFFTELLKRKHKPFIYTCAPSDPVVAHIDSSDTYHFSVTKSIEDDVKNIVHHLAEVFQKALCSKKHPTELKPIHEEEDGNGNQPSGINTMNSDGNTSSVNNNDKNRTSELPQEEESHTNTSASSKATSINEMEEKSPANTSALSKAPGINEMEEDDNILVTKDLEESGVKIISIHFLSVLLIAVMNIVSK